MKTTNHAMNSFIRGAAGQPAPAPAPAAVTPKPVTVNGGEGTAAPAPRKIGMNDFMRAAKFGTPL